MAQRHEKHASVTLSVVCLQRKGSVCHTVERFLASAEKRLSIYIVI